MDSEKRSRLLETYREAARQLENMSRVMALSLSVSSEAHKGQISKSTVQKSLNLIEVFQHFDEFLRKDTDGSCPDCGGDHPPISSSDGMLELKVFVKESSKHPIVCTWCFDQGWLHSPPGACRGTGEADKHYHIERCDSCKHLKTDREAVNAHSRECGCELFQYDCDHFNNDTFKSDDKASDQPRSHSDFKLLKESDDTMANAMKAAPDSKIDDKFKDVGILRLKESDKPKIHLPEGMDNDTAIFWLKKLRDEEDKEVSIDHKFTGYYPPDAAYALTKAIERTYGFVSQEKTPGFFQMIPPATIGIEISLNDITQIPWGRMTFHGVGGHVDTTIALVDGFPVMALKGLIRKGDKDKIEKLVQLTKQILAEESIYRGKAVKIDFSNFSPDDPRFEPMKAPKFLDVTKTSVNSLILSKDVFEAVEANLFTPIRFTQICRDSGIPLRRGILLAGPFGTGKTLTALVTAREAVDNKWTFIYLTDLKQLPQALQFAKNYAPAVVFGEDIDRVLDGDRDEEMDTYLNSMDGVDRKSHEVMVVFTTNNVENIHPAMMRPGRIDAIIPIDPPDAEATVRLLKQYGHGLIDTAADLNKVGELLAGQIPAVCREVVERSKLRAIRDSKNGKVVITEKHLLQAGTEMLKHVEYITEEEKDDRHPMEVFGEAIGSRISDAVSYGRRDGAPDRTKIIDASDSKGFVGVLEEAAKQAHAELNTGNGKS